ncbi:mig-6 [Cordylochernes scorpioides]|uniref:Mig-6 n=1 Tax=Cordylochernes scorpioides TaxID=51811 RepID=A0ABY6LLP7_9ARAC|nr:mig-6 [Cordylochernes scorpioides]
MYVCVQRTCDRQNTSIGSITYVCRTCDRQNTSIGSLTYIYVCSENMCLFDRRYYAVGHILEGSNQTSYCVTCTCLTPPDFTCVHQSCSPPPNNDYVNCVPSYIPGECCPTYNCSHLLSGWWFSLKHKTFIKTPVLYYDALCLMMH